MRWSDYVPRLLSVHRVLHSGESLVEFGTQMFTIEVVKTQTKDYRMVNLPGGWRLLTQNLSKNSANTHRVMKARNLGGDLYISWLRAPAGHFVGQFTTEVDKYNNRRTIVRDLRRNEPIYLIEE